MHMEIFLVVASVLGLGLLAALASLIRWLCAKPTDQEVEDLAKELVEKSGMVLPPPLQPEAEGKAKPAHTKRWIRLAVFGKDNRNRKTRRKIRAGRR